MSKNLGSDIQKFDTVRPYNEWHENFGPVLWWRFPINESPYVGSPRDTEWKDDYYTHWSPLPVVCGESGLPLLPRKREHV
ncbi:MAG: hypothetical protein IIB83_06685, partial [Bacteroidetes bacterium]|nr:hypothetical protein [Bacteroidota bacterium]